MLPTRRSRVSIVAVATAVLLSSAAAHAADPTTCPGGSFDPPNNGGTNTWSCAVSGNSGTLTSLTLSTSISFPFPSACSPEHSWTLVSPAGTEHALGNRNGTQSTVIDSTFDGEGSNGTWSLKETDRNGNDACNGTLGNFTLDFTLAGGVAPPTVSFNETSVTENGGPTLNVKIVTDDGNPTTASATVNVGLDSGNEGSATSGSDYTLSVTTLTIPAGTATNTLLPIGTVADDAALERSETIRLVFSSPSGVTASSSAHTVTISDDETASIHFSAASSSVSEFGSPTHGIQLEVAVTSGDGTGTVGTNLWGTISRTSGTATQGTYNAACPNGDFSFYDDPVTFNGSDDWFLNASTPTWTSRIRVCDDGTGDAGETVVLGINLTTTGVPNVSISGQTSHTVTITETTSVAVDDASATEGSPVVFTISLSAPAPAGGVMIGYQTASGGSNPATAGTDYTAASGSATIGSGASSTTVSVATTADTSVESDETFLLQLTSVSDASFAISDDEGTGTITNDDTQFSAFLLSPDPANEGDGGGTTPFTVRVLRNGFRPDGQTIQVQTVAGSATGGGVDYADVPLTTLTFALNEGFKDVAFDVVADDVDEANETLTFDLSNASGGAAIASDLTITILDDDNPTLAIDDVTVNESAGTVTFTVTETGATTFPLSVDYGTSNQTATAPDDYTATSGTLTFAGTNGETHQIVVTIADDDLEESAETFRVFLTNAVGGDIADNQGVATILDNDVPSITINDVSAAEDAGSATFLVSSGVRVQSGVTVTWSTANGTAIAPGDYTAVVGGAVVIAAGNKQVVLNVALADDADVEGPETFSVTITDADGKAIADATGVATILDDDRPDGDMDGDGHPDILWRNEATGANAIWCMNDTVRVRTVVLPTATDLGWRIVGTGDFDGDTDPDIAWRHAIDGRNAVWYLEGDVVAGTAGLPASANTTWHVAAVADFDGDGDPDLLWRNEVSLEVAVWLMDGTTLSSTVALPPPSNPAWRIDGAADLTGDGKPDILWRNSVTGSNAVWLMDGTTHTSSALLPATADPDWEMAAFADYDGDGDVDIVWRHAGDGRVAYWYMDGLTFVSATGLPAITNLDWDVVGP